MHTMRKYYILIFIFMGVWGLKNGLAQSGLEYRIFLKNNEVIEGELLGINPNIS